MEISYEANVLCDGLPSDRECPKNGIITTEPAGLLDLDLNAITRFILQRGWKVLVEATDKKGSVPIILGGRLTKLHHSKRHGKSRVICPHCADRLETQKKDK